jgi:hypothetical protein
MKRCIFDISCSCSVKFRLDDGEEEFAESLMEMLERGDPPPWLHTLVVESMLKNLQIEGWEIIGLEPAPDEELDFGE